MVRKAGPKPVVGRTAPPGVGTKPPAQAPKATPPAPIASPNIPGATKPGQVPGTPFKKLGPPGVPPGKPSNLPGDPGQARIMPVTGKPQGRDTGWGKELTGDEPNIRPLTPRASPYTKLKSGPLLGPRRGMGGEPLPDFRPGTKGGGGKGGGIPSRGKAIALPPPAKGLPLKPAAKRKY